MTDRAEGYALEALHDPHAVPKALFRDRKANRFFATKHFPLVQERATEIVTRLREVHPFPGFLGGNRTLQMADNFASTAAAGAAANRRRRDRRREDIGDIDLPNGMNVRPLWGAATSKLDVIR